MKKTGIFPRIVLPRDVFSVFTFFVIRGLGEMSGGGGPTSALQFHAARGVQLAECGACLHGNGELHWRHVV